MATREEIETLIEQVKSQITSTQTSLTEAMNQTLEAGTEEASRGHHGIANLYQSGRQKLEESYHQISSSITLLEEAGTLISQAQGLRRPTGPPGNDGTGTAAPVAHGPPTRQPASPEPDHRELPGSRAQHGDNAGTSHRSPPSTGATPHGTAPRVDIESTAAATASSPTAPSSRYRVPDSPPSIAGNTKPYKASYTQVVHPMAVRRASRAIPRLLLRIVGHDLASQSCMPITSNGWPSSGRLPDIDDTPAA